MAATVMMYILPMLLGQTYDLGKEIPGLQIFPDNVKDDAEKIEHFLTDSQYRMVENAQEMKDFLDVSGKLAIKIKAGIVDISGEGRYLKDSSFKSNGLEILIKLHFETVTFTIPSWKKPNADWNTLPRQFLGTHYCRSLTYGGDLVASVRITGQNQYDLEQIKGAVTGSVKTTGGAFEGHIMGQLELLKQNALDSSSMEINYYASVPLHGVSYTIDGLMSLIDNFPDHVKKVNNGIGNPLKMELYPLNSLLDSYPAYLENRALSDELDDLDSQFDDLRNTRHQFNIWTTQLPPSIPQSIKKKIGDFSDKLNSVNAVFAKAVAELDTAQGASTQPIQDALEAYKDNGYVLHQKYYRKFRSLQKEIYEEAPASKPQGINNKLWKVQQMLDRFLSVCLNLPGDQGKFSIEFRPKTGGAHYVRWGRSDCSSAETELSVAGVATASEAQSELLVKPEGGSSDFSCSEIDVEKVKPEDYFKNYNANKKNILINISTLRYKGDMNKFRTMLGKNLACAHCRALSRTALIVKVATNACPDGWIKEYGGYLMAPGKGTKGEYICVDQDMKEPSRPVNFGSATKNNFQELKEVTVRCGSLPCERYEQSKPIDCVVCTI